MLYTVRDVAKLMRTDVHNVYKLINSGLLPAIKIGSLKVREEALDQFLKDYEGFDISNAENISRLNGT